MRFKKLLRHGRASFNWTYDVFLILMVLLPGADRAGSGLGRVQVQGRFRVVFSAFKIRSF
jgi:hypothetical protein